MRCQQLPNDTEGVTRQQLAVPLQPISALLVHAVASQQVHSAQPASSATAQYHQLLMHL